MNDAHYIMRYLQHRAFKKDEKAISGLVQFFIEHREVNGISGGRASYGSHNFKRLHCSKKYS